MLDQLAAFDWCTHLVTIFALSTLTVSIVAVLMVLAVPISDEDLRDHDADIEQAINIANSH